MARLPGEAPDAGCRKAQRRRRSACGALPCPSTGGVAPSSLTRSRAAREHAHTPLNRWRRNQLPHQDLRCTKLPNQ